MNYLNCNILIKIVVTSLLAVWKFSTPAYSQKEIELSTIYKNRVFETMASIETDASVEVASTLLYDLNIHLCNLELDSLSWATKGLAGKQKGKDLIWIEYKNGVYNRNTETFLFLIEIYLGITKRQIKDLKLDIILKKELTNPDKNPFITVELCKSGSFLRKAYGTIIIRKKDNKSEFIIKSSIQFGWFFNLFISKSNYASIAEWRIKTLLYNLKTEAEQRQHARTKIL